MSLVCYGERYRISEYRDKISLLESGMFLWSLWPPTCVIPIVQCMAFTGGYHHEGSFSIGRLILCIPWGAMPCNFSKYKKLTCMFWGSDSLCLYSFLFSFLA